MQTYKQYETECISFILNIVVKGGFSLLSGRLVEISRCPTQRRPKTEIKNEIKSPDYRRPKNDR